MKNYILFDLDGTIINSQLGVTMCVQYALGKLGIEEPDLDKLCVFIGPPLRGQFQKEYGLTEEQAEEAVKYYRERYSQKGMYECSLYPYSKEILSHLKENGYYLSLASSKNESACRGILEHFRIDGYFDFIGGATDDGKISEKKDVLQLVIDHIGAEKLDEMVLVGDTRFDVLGANAVSMDCIGVTFGFGTQEELEEAGANQVFHRLEEVEAYLEQQ